MTFSTVAKFATLAILLVPALAQSGRTIILTWDDPNGVPDATYRIYRAPGVCSGNPSWAPIAAGVTAKTYSDPGVTPGNYCYTVTVTINGVESAQAVPAGPLVTPRAVSNIQVQVNE